MERCAAVDEMLIMLPPSRIKPDMALITWKGPPRLIAITRSQSSSVVSATRLSSATPALLIRTSTCPNKPCTRSVASWIEARLSKSISMISRRPACFVTSSANTPERLPVRELAITDAPCSSIRLDRCKPIPDEAPVIQMTFSLTQKRSDKRTSLVGGIGVYTVAQRIGDDLPSCCEITPSGSQAQPVSSADLSRVAALPKR